MMGDTIVLLCSRESRSHDNNNMFVSLAIAGHAKYDIRSPIHCICTFAQPICVFDALGACGFVVASSAARDTDQPIDIDIIL